MKSFLIMGLAGTGLFTGTVFGLLAAQGRLNFEGTRGVPGIEILFSAPEDAGEEHSEGEQGEDVTPREVPTHAGMLHDAENPERLDGLGREERLPRQIGPEVASPEASATHAPPGRRQGGESGGHESSSQHGDTQHGEGAGHGETSVPPAPGVETAPPSAEFLHETRSLMGQDQYRRGKLFAFPRLSSGMSVAEINELVAGARNIEQDLERRKAALGQRDVELSAREADIEERERAVLAKMREVTQQRTKLEEEINTFQETFTLVRKNEVDQFRSYADSLAALSTEKSSQIIMQLWETEAGREKAVKILKLMPNETKGEIFGVLDGRQTQEILDRLTGAVVEGAGK